MRSHILEGTVRHRRSKPFVYELEHDLFYLALDLSELEEVGRKHRLIGHNRWGPLSFRDDDHWLPPAENLDASVREHLRTEGFADAGDWQITLIANLRVLGYVFNPASFYLCRDGEGTLRVVVVEVHNTHGERHLYTLRPRDAAPTFVASMVKAFYVSPFLETDGAYTVTVRDASSRLRITINHVQSDGLVLHASLDLVRRPLTDRNLVRMLLQQPLVTHKTTLMIHWHALRLWLRGARFHRHRAGVR
jgi:DUF1365 family protein